MILAQLAGIAALASLTMGLQKNPWVMRPEAYHLAYAEPILQRSVLIMDIPETLQHGNDIRTPIEKTDEKMWVFFNAIGLAKEGCSVSYFARLVGYISPAPLHVTFDSVACADLLLSPNTQLKISDFNHAHRSEGNCMGGWNGCTVRVSNGRQFEQIDLRRNSRNSTAPTGQQMCPIKFPYQCELLMNGEWEWE